MSPDTTTQKPADHEANFVNWAKEQIRTRFKSLEGYDIATLLFGAAEEIPALLGNQELRQLKRTCVLEHDAIASGQGPQGSSPLEPFAEWVEQRIVPAIRAAAASDFRECSELGNIVPLYMRGAWRATLAKWRAEAPEEPFGSPRWTHYRQTRLLRGLNDTILLPKRLYLGFWQQQGAWELQLGVVLQRLIYPSNTGPIEAYVLRAIDAPPRCVNCAYSEAVTDRIVCWDNAIRGATELQFRLAGAKADDPWIAIVAPERLVAEMEFSSWVVQRFSDKKSYFSAFTQRILVEEIRHSIDRRRLPRFSDGYGRVGEHLLHRVSRVYREYWCHVPPEDDERSDHSIMELSAQLTAAAIAPEPAMVFREWLRNLRAPLRRDEKQRERRQGHDDASELAVLLLAEHQGLITSGLLFPKHHWIFSPVASFMRFFGARLEEFHLHDRAGLAKLAKLLAEDAEKNTNDTRRRVQQVYAANFHAPIDEQPFAQILGDGTLRKRPMPSA